MSTPGITTASLSDVGRVRTRNEDACDEFVHESGYRLLVVADGMGGHRAGETASRLAIQTIGEVFADLQDEPEDTLRRAIETANARIHELAVMDSELRGMGTTTVALLLGPNDEAWVAHVGDSRAYLLRSGSLAALTRDHSVVAELERRGLLSPEEAAVHPRRNEILRSVGVQRRVEVDITRIELSDDDRFVLCSDGLSGLVPESEIEAIAGREPPHVAVRLLVDAANASGGNDNVTVQIAWVGGSDASTRQADEGTTPTDDDLSQAATETTTPPAPAGDASPPAHDTKSPSDAGRRRRALVVVAAVLIAGLASLTVLWRLYMLSRPAPTAVIGAKPAIERSLEE